MAVVVNIYIYICYIYGLCMNVSICVSPLSVYIHIHIYVDLYLRRVCEGRKVFWDVGENACISQSKYVCLDCL